jgi:hypothetical protein
MTGLRVVRLIALLVVGVCVAAGCTPGTEPAPHPLGAACTWPASVDPQRDGLAVLTTSADEAEELVLLDVASGAVRSRCVGVPYFWSAPSIGRGFPSGGVQAAGSVLFPPVSPDWRFALSAAGIVELATGQVVAAPVAGWRAVALPGRGRVLRLREQDDVPRGDWYYEPAHWCLAPRFAAPPADCAPLPGSGPGFPVVHRDGTVGWAPARPVPVQVGRLSGVVQTDGDRIVQLQLADSSGDGTAVVDASGRAGLLGRAQFRYAPGNAEMADRPAWYTLEHLDAAGARATLHVGVSSWTEVSALGDGMLPQASAAAVVDRGRAVVVALPGSSSPTTYFVRIAEDAPARVLARLQRGPGPEAQIGGTPVILAWPDSASTVQS